MKVALLGATRGIGRALARELARSGEELFLLGRSPEQLARSARDLEAHGARAPVGGASCDLLEPDSFAPALARAVQALGRLDAVVLSAALYATQRELERDTVRRRALLAADFANSVEFCEQARALLLAGGGGALCVFSSVAGERARRPVVLYGAAKAGLTHYLEGLDHLDWRRGLRVICVKPGFVRTGMTAGLREPPFAASPERVARQVAAALRRPRPVLYSPPVWRWVMAGVRRLPRAVLRRAEF